MTAQIDDTFQYHSAEYSVAGISKDKLFDPAIFKLKPMAASTACWRGYQAVFGISDSHLILDALYVNLCKEGEGFQRKQGPVINGIKPITSRGKHDFFNNHYKGLNYRLEYTGGLLLADGFIQDLYVHMGFHPAWKYNTVMELIFENGILTGEFDRSERMAEIRQMIPASRDDQERERMPTKDEIRAFVQRAFDRTYRM